LGSSSLKKKRHDLNTLKRSSLVDFVDRYRKLFILTGAGCSRASGIPTYRDENGDWKLGRRPMMLQSFLADERARQRYWARSLVGWRRIRSSRPNDAHRALARLESLGRVQQLVTQNVDGLHQAAGSRRVIDLHGRLDKVCCLGCEARIPRDRMQAELVRRNPELESLQALAAPDGDADLEGIDCAALDVPVCDACGGTLKPDIVFFGEGVPKDRVHSAMAQLARADAMLVVGSSLMVYSGFRFAKAMMLAGKPIAAVNIGRTRADDMFSLKVTNRCADALAFLLSAGTGAAESRLSGRIWPNFSGHGADSDPK
jgi:NAD-dependent SIR2 family protein deacetylase